jgi:tetratricopeptide (TPR) repeat protein
MKTTSTLPVIVFCLALTCLVMAVENPNVSTSFEASTNVPSQGRQRRMLTSPNPLSAGSNDVVTGNVGGMRHFRGVVPYGSQYYSGANLGDTGTESVSAFLRRSTDPVLNDRNPGQTRVFYEPRRTASNFYVQNGQRTALSESVTRGQARPYVAPNLTQLLSSDNLQRPLSSNNLELDQILTRQEQLKQAARDSARDSLTDEKDQFKDFFEIVLAPEDPVITPPQEPLEQLEPETEQRRDVDAIDREPEPVLPDEMPEQEDYLKEEDQEPVPAEPDDPLTPRRQEQPAEEAESTPDAIHSEAARIRGEHKTFSSLAQARFTEYMRAAETFMRDGKFYKAADAYSLASIWMAEDARPYAGQSFSLYAAGEYMSSAYYLSRAIEIDPQLAAKKYDLAGLIGDRDIFENRLIEIATWQQRSDSGELAFLMAYVLYHDGKAAKAGQAINVAAEKMPDSKAVSILKQVILPENGTP